MKIISKSFYILSYFIFSVTSFGAFAIDFNVNAAKSIDNRIANKHAAINKPIFTSLDHVKRKFVRNPDCWAADLDLTCISPSNYKFNELHAGTLITPRHAILAAHFKLSTGDSLFFVTKDNVTIGRKIIGYKVNTQFSPIQFPDLEIVVLESDVPNSITPCVFLPADYYNYIDFDGSGLPMLNSDQEKKALVSEIKFLNDWAVINGNPKTKMMVRQTSTLPNRKALTEGVVSGDSGNPSFLILNDKLVLLSLFTWGDGSGTSYAEYANLPSGGTLNSMSINDLIAQADVAAGISSGYQVSYFDFSATAITEIENKISAKVFAIGQTLNVRFNQNSSVFNIQVRNVLAKEITNQITSESLFTYELPTAGVYIVTIINGINTKSYKLLVP